MPSSGQDLIRKKLARTVVMGGRFVESWLMVICPDGNENAMRVTWEWNIKGSGLRAAQTACDLWCGELLFSGYERLLHQNHGWLSDEGGKRQSCCFRI